MPSARDSDPIGPAGATASPNGASAGQPGRTSDQPLGGMVPVDAGSSGAGSGGVNSSTKGR